MVNRYQNLELLVNEGIQIALQAAAPDKTIGVMLEYLGRIICRICRLKSVISGIRSLVRAGKL